MSRVVSIGYEREDGELAVLATLNNRDEHMSAEDFDRIVAALVVQLQQSTDIAVAVYDRQDAPDYVSIDEECW